MRQVTAREKVFLGIGVAAALAILVYFVFWPMLQGDQSGSESSLEELQARLEAVKKLENMAPTLIGLEERVKEQSGYGGVSFTRGIAGSSIFSYLAKAAAQADIKNLEQLDPKPYTGKKSQTETVSDQTVLRAIVDQMYLGQVTEEMKRENDDANEDSNVGGPSDASPESDAPEESESKETDDRDNFDLISDFDPDQIPPDAIKFLEERGVSIEELKENPELRMKLRREFEKWVMEAKNESLPDEPEISQKENPPVSDVPKQPEPAGSDENLEQTEKLIFPPIPKTIPSEAKQSLVKWIMAHPGKAMVLSDMNWILNDAGMEDEEENARVKKWLKLYSERVGEVKKELRQWLTKLEVSKDAKSGQKAEKFTVRMVFKSQMEQLVKLLYNLQESAKWLKIESMRVSISDRKETLLSVELSMTATTLYNL